MADGREEAIVKYSDIERMCRPVGRVRGCPHDGLGCTGGERCSINDPDATVRAHAWVADKYGPAFVCVKHQAVAGRKR